MHNGVAIGVGQEGCDAKLLAECGTYAGRSDTNKRLEGRVAMVTGANQGLGLHTASELASRGATLLMVSKWLHCFDGPSTPTGNSHRSPQNSQEQTLYINKHYKPALSSSGPANGQPRTPSCTLEHSSGDPG